MADIPQEVVDDLTATVDKFHQVLHGTDDFVTTEGGQVKTLHKVLADAETAIAAIEPGYDGKEDKSAKNASNGYPGLSALKIAIKNAAGTVTSTIASLATVARNWDLPDHSGTLATTSDITAVTATIGQANGIAPLDGTSKIAAIYLPSFVDDVLEYANLAGFPGTGETGKIYVALDTNKTYRWGGSAYTEISPSPGSTDAVPEGASNLYFTDARVRAAVLTGLGAGTNVAIAAGDTILAAFAKLQNQITAVLAYVDLAILQTVHKGTARVVARTNLALTGLQTVDGVTLIAGDIILLTGQTAPAQNGPYVVAAGAWTRATNANTSAKMVLNATWHIREGSIYAGTTWFLATSAVTLDTTGLAITLVGQAIDWSTFIGGKPAAAATVLFAKATRPFSLPAALAGSQSEAGTAATASSVFTVYKNATSIGTITVSAAGTVGAFAAASKTDFAVGDKLKITAPGSQDGTLADISINLAGYLS